MNEFLKMESDPKSKKMGNEPKSKSKRFSPIEPKVKIIEPKSKSKIIQPRVKRSAAPGWGRREQTCKMLLRSTLSILFG